MKTAMLLCLFAICLCLVLVQCRNVENNGARVKRTSEGFSDNCEKANSFLRSIQLPPNNGPKGSICGGQCCGPDAEFAFHREGQKKFAELLSDNSKSLQGTLRSTSNSLQNHVTDLAHQSENKTLLLFTQVYRSTSVHMRTPIATLFSDIRRYVVQPTAIVEGATFSTSTPKEEIIAPAAAAAGAAVADANAAATASYTTTAAIDINVSVNQLFSNMFPLVYHYYTGHQQQDFTVAYKQCLRERVSEVQPFGDIPRQIAQSLAKSLESTRLLLEALSVGLEVLNATDVLITEEDGKSNVECHGALMKMMYCPSCQGLRLRSADVKPCAGYCLNVLRGCLTKYVAELDAPWNGFVEALERLVTAMKQHNNEAGVNADAVIRMLDTRISEAIMYAMEKGEEVDTRVKRICGPPEHTAKDEPSFSQAPSTVDGGTSNTQLSSALPISSPTRLSSSMRTVQPTQEAELQQFLIAVEKSRGFYGNLADNLCRDNSFAELQDFHCWNGERVGEYLKTVVYTGVDMQKYNPELKPNTNIQNVDDRVANWADKLRHYSQMVMSSLGAIGLPESDSFMQGDATDGSGSGNGNYEDTDDIRGSGSGDGTDYSGPARTVPNDKPTTENSNNERKAPTQGANAVMAPSLLVATALVITLSAMFA